MDEMYDSPDPDDERAIVRVIHRYARGVDTGEIALVRDCYWPGAMDYHAGFTGPVEAYCEWLAEMLPGVDVVTHMMMNVEVGAATDDGSVRRSTARSYCLNAMVWHVAEGPDRHVLSGLVYDDAFECRDTQWRIAERRCTRLWTRLENVATDAALPLGMEK